MDRASTRHSCIAPVVAALWVALASGGLAKGEPQTVGWLAYPVQPTNAATARLDVRADRPAGRPLSRGLYGKFTEHLGRNVYNGIWAQILVNPGFEGPEKFLDARGGGRPLSAVADRLAWQERAMGIAGLREGFGKGVAPYWAAFGSAGAYRLAEGAFNSDRCQRIDLTGQAAGVQQPIHLPMHRVGTFELTLAARSGGVGELRVSIRKGPKAGKAVTPAVAVGPVADRWRKLRAVLKVTDAHAKRGDLYWLRIEAAGKGTLWLDQVFLFPTDHVGGFDPDVVRLLKDSRLPLLRFPGGNFVSGYHWKDGVGPLDERPTKPNPAWNNIEYNHVGTDEMTAFCRAVGCEPMICVNAGSGTAQEAAEWVEYCNGGTKTRFGSVRAKHGHPKPYNVRYWEVGNELYGNWQIGHCDAATYAERYKAFRAAMLAADPKIKLIANGHSSQWNAEVIRGNPKTVRSLSVHTLLGSGACSETDPKKVFQAMMGFTHVYPQVLRGRAAMRAGEGRRHVAITELQLFTNVPNLPNNKSLAEALWTASILNVGIRSGGMVELITHSALVNHGGGLSKRAEFVWANPVHWTHHLYATQTGVAPLEVGYAGPCLDSPGVRGVGGSRGAPVLDAVGLLSEDGKELTLLVVNRHAEKALPARIALHGFRAKGRAKIVTLAATSFMAANTFECPDAVGLVESTAATGPDGLEHEFPKHSLTAVVFRRQDVGGGAGPGDEQ